ncbi:endocuticle structural glycoprotein SgAbd-2-like [Photinus pyralis]|nr:endocuticle structural glycoprotein SgAbd-2-like [Photinus pyralis]
MMKYLVATLCFVGACIAQESHGRRYQQPHQQPHQQQPQQQEGQQNQHYQEPPQQYHENRRHESTTYIPIIRFDKEQGADGSYKALWETGNNILAQEEGYLKDLGPDPDAKGETLHAQVQQGSFTYTAPNGEVIVTRYTADETGFHVEGDHLPTPPPVSPEVQKGLDLIYAGIRQQQEQAAREYTPEAKQSQDYREPGRQSQRNQLQQEYNRQNQYQQEYNGPQQRQHQQQ